MRGGTTSSAAAPRQKRSIFKSMTVWVFPYRFCFPPLIRPALRRATFPQGKAIRTVMKRR
uniref:Uncharacterized protein n=1 Tax=Podoviridae sp. ctgFL11 TaxID=2827744 RepID=A0A8S5SXF6_9CAUD|nr:MAG TPA: hypothetical protein [Podoviridae sp. ctgFL11]